MTRLILPLLLILLTFPFPAVAKEPIRTLYGVVTRVVDGDTIAVDAEGTKVKVRLEGIDAPEVSRVNQRTGAVSKPGQLFGEEARAALAKMVLLKQIRLDVMGLDKYRRALAVVWVNGLEVNREMVAEGWAWAYRKYSLAYVQEEERARRSGLGLWADGRPVPPWDFRRLYRIR